jgi:hypothetical protein
MNSAAWIGPAGSALLFATAVLTVSKAERYSIRIRSLIFVLAFFAASIPVLTLPLAGTIRGGVGDLSVTSLLLLTITVLSKLIGKPLVHPKSTTVLALIVLGSGVMLYPSALGATYWDLYALGYGTKLLFFAFLLVSLGAWTLGYHLVAICLTASSLAYSLQIFESRNLWDYWIDPLLVVYALYRISKALRSAELRA